MTHGSSTNAIAHSVTAFSRADTTFFKGVAILLIVTHNFFHVRSGFGIENEMSFSRENLLVLADYYSSVNLDHWLAATFGFFGHYGVQIFIFFSAYGLSIQYRTSGESDLRFVLHHLRKIYFLLAFGILFIVLVAALVARDPYPLEIILRNTFLLSTTVGGFFVNRKYEMFLGPFWFFALIIQLYALLPFLYRVTASFTQQRVWGLFVIAYALIYVAFILGSPRGLSVFSTILGHLPEALFGIYIAQSGQDALDEITRPRYLILFAIVFWLSQLYITVFPLSFLCATVILLVGTRQFEVFAPPLIRRVLLFCGEISMILFLINARVRSTRIFVSYTIVEFIIFIPVLFIASYLLYRLYRYLTVKLNI